MEGTNEVGRKMEGKIGREKTGGEENGPGKKWVEVERVKRVERVERVEVERKQRARKKMVFKKIS